MTSSPTSWVLPLIVLLAGLAAEAQEPAQDERERRRLVDLSIEELMNVEVTTAAKKEQRLIEVPSAMTVIRGEDLRRTGVRTIPDALRSVPGLHVARIDANKWVVASRGFSNRSPTSSRCCSTDARCTPRCSRACSGKRRTR